MINLAKNIPEQDTSVIFCKVSIDNDDKWVHGIITYINLDKSIAEVFLSAKYFKEYLREGSKIQIKSLGDDNETLLVGSITRKVISIRKQAITVQLDKVINYSNHRKAERFHVNYSCSIKCDNKDEYWGTLYDISSGGCMIYSVADINPSAEVKITIFVSPSIRIEFSGLIIRKHNTKTKGISYGVQLCEIDSENETMLSELIKFLITQKNHINHEWRVFKKLKLTVYTITVLAIFIIVFFVFASKVYSPH